MCVIWKKTLYSTLILGSVFSDYVVAFTGIIINARSHRDFFRMRAAARS